MPEITLPAARTPWSPAAIPATCVAWSDSSGSYGAFAYFQVSLEGAHPRAPCELGARHDDGQPVEDDLVAPADPRSRDCCLDPRGDARLRRVERLQVRDARGRAHVEPAMRRRGGERAVVVHGVGERRL